MQSDASIICARLLGTTPNVFFFFELGDEANNCVQKGSSTHYYPILSTNLRGIPPVVLNIYILPHFVHHSTPLCARPYTHQPPDLRNIVAPPRTIRKWFRRLAFWILRTRAQDPCSCCCRPTPRHQDGKILLRLCLDEKVKPTFDAADPHTHKEAKDDCITHNDVCTFRRRVGYGHL